MTVSQRQLEQRTKTSLASEVVELRNRIAVLEAALCDAFHQRWNALRLNHIKAMVEAIEEPHGTE